MKTGIELIAEERQEQISKHGRTVLNDVFENKGRQLVKAAQELLEQLPINTGFPPEWDKDVVDKMRSKSYYKRLIIAGALIAAEIDRINQDY